MTILWIDFETRSRCDLRSRGVYNYAQDASTDVLCMSYAFGDDEVRTWLPGQPFPPAVAAHSGQIRAHNAAFERLIFWYVLQIDYRLEQFYCTAAQARANCAPGSLEDVGRFAGASMKKDHRGSQLIRLLSIPQADGGFREDAALMAEMVRYCESDVRAMRAVSQAQRALSADELADYHTNERINDRGVLLDKPLAEAAVRYAEAELVEIQDSVAEITGGEITSVRSPKMRAWVLDRVGPQALKLATVYKDGVAKLSIDKTVRANLLALAEENPDEVPADVAEVIQCADDLWASSVAKFNRAAALADAEDCRVRGAFVFAGGSATGRASSFGLQCHNYPRKCAADPALVRQAMVRGHQIVPTHGKRVTDVLKGMLRPSLLAAPGKVLVVADWAAIEARVTPWASNTNSGAAKLDIFAKASGKRAGAGLEDDPFRNGACALQFGDGLDHAFKAKRRAHRDEHQILFGRGRRIEHLERVKQQRIWPDRLERCGLHDNCGRKGLRHAGKGRWLVKSGKAVDRNERCTGRARGEAGEQDGACPCADDNIGPLGPDRANRLAQIPPAGFVHVDRMAKLGLTQRKMIDEMGAVLFSDTTAKRRIFGDEEMVVRAPNGFKIKQLAHMPAARRCKADAHTASRPRQSCPSWQGCGMQRLTPRHKGDGLPLGGRNLAFR